MDRDWEVWRRMRHTELGADWRWRSAIDFVASGKARMPVEFDAATREAGDFLRRKSQGEQHAADARRKYPFIAMAEAAWSQSELRAALQTLVLGNVPPADICTLLQLEQSVLEVIENLHFDVRPLLTATQWIVTRVISSEADAGRDDVAARLRMAYFGGPYAAKALIEAKLRLPTEPAQRLFDASTLLHAKFVQAIEMPLTPETSIEFIRLNAKILRDEQHLQLEREKLTFRMQRWVQRYELAQTRASEPQVRTDAAVDGEAVEAPKHSIPAKVA